MNQNPSDSRLGRKLLAARESARVTQADLAFQATCSTRSVWRAESGQGSAGVYLALVGALGLEVTGRSLPPGDHLGARLLYLRLRTGRSRRQVAEASRASATSIAGLEAGRLGHMAVLERVGEALGAGLTVVPKGSAPAFFAGSALSSAWDAWATPPDLLDRLYRVVGGGFELDPCSPGRGRCRVSASTHYDEEDDGLSQHWRGSVYMNPPYGREIGLWTAKAREEVRCGRASSVVALLPARTDTRWWHADIVGRADAWLLRGRLSFGDGEQSAPFASALVVWPPGLPLAVAMDAEFPDAWRIPAGEGC